MTDPRDEDFDRRAFLTDEIASRPEADPRELGFALDGPLTVRRGETVTHGLLLTNLGSSDVTVRTAGDVIGRIKDPETGEIVGGFTGAHRLPLVRFTAAPGRTIRIPLLVGTTSYRPRPGELVAAGRWQLVVPLDLDDGRHLVTPPLEFTIIG